MDLPAQDLKQLCYNTFVLNCKQNNTLIPVPSIGYRRFSKFLIDFQQMPPQTTRHPMEKIPIAKVGIRSPIVTARAPRLHLPASFYSNFQSKTREIPGHLFQHDSISA